MKDKIAIITLGGRQHLVSEGTKLTVDRLSAEPGKKLELGDVMLISEGEKTVVGTPIVPNTKVTLNVLEHGKGKKVTVSRFRAKSRYRRTLGHRQAQTTVEVVGIN